MNYHAACKVKVHPSRNGARLKKHGRPLRIQHGGGPKGSPGQTAWHLLVRSASASEPGGDVLRCSSDTRSLDIVLSGLVGFISDPQKAAARLESTVVQVQPAVVAVLRTFPGDRYGGCISSEQLRPGYPLPLLTRYLNLYALTWRLLTRPRSRPRCPIRLLRTC